MSRAWIAMVLAIFASAEVLAADMEIFHAEPVSLQSTAAVQGKPQNTVQFTALGRTFRLQLESNEQLLRLLPAETRSRLNAVSLRRGTLQDVPQSWVRLTEIDGTYQGAIWDGTELYVIAPTQSIVPHLSMPITGQKTGTAIYRLNDSRSETAGKICAADRPQNFPANAGTTYKRLRNELQALDATASLTEIHVAMIGDFEFTAAHGSGAVIDMATRASLVDAIFTSQLGVSVVPTDFVTYTTDSDPFTSSNSNTLLDQLASYRSNDATIRSRGLAHLLTGRELDGNIIGIGRLNALCQPGGVSLSEVSWFVDSALVMAHELGHNFGAPHDGETGSACVSTAQSYLMAPELNGSSTFSSCSIQQMRPAIAAATCITPVRTRDVAIDIADDEIEATTGQSIDVVATVSSHGEAAATNITVTSSASSALDVFSASIENGQCMMFIDSHVACSLEQLAPGQQAELRIRYGAGSISNGFPLTLTADSTGDADPDNNTDSVTIRVGSGYRVDVEALPQPLELDVGSTAELTVNITSSGSFPVPDAYVSLLRVGTKVLSASVDGGTCTVDRDSLTCALGTLETNAVRQLRISFTTTQVGQYDTFLTLSSSPVSLNYRKDISITSLALHDIGVTLSPASQRLTIGDVASTDVVVRSFGKLPVENVRVLVFGDTTLSAEPTIASGVACTQNGSYWACELGTMSAGDSRAFTVLSRASAPGRGSIRVMLNNPTTDDYANNNAQSTWIDARFGSDLAAQAVGTFNSVEQRQATFSGWITSQGNDPAHDATATVTLPEGFVVHEATAGSQPCVITDHVAACTVATVDVDASIPITVTYTATTAGSYTGTLEVAVNGDGDLLNNAASIPLHVVPEVDAKLSVPPSPPAIFIGEGLDLQYTIDTNRYVLTDAVLLVSGFHETELAEVTPQLSCPMTSNYGLECNLGDLAGNTRQTVTLHFVPLQPRHANVQAILRAPADIDGMNNYGYTEVVIYEPGNAAIVADATSYTGETGQWVEIPLSLNTDISMESPRFSIEADASRLSGAMLSGYYFCPPSLTPFVCNLNYLVPGEPRHVVLSLQLLGEGPLQVRAVLTAENEVSPDDNHVDFTINVTAAQPPTPTNPTPAPTNPTPNPPRSSGGGGGDVGLLMLFALSTLLPCRRILTSRSAAFAVHRSNHTRVRAERTLIDRRHPSSDVC